MEDGLVIEGVEKRFGANPVLAGVDLSAPPGRITALIGQNGAGKSTLFKILMGLLAADAGRATVDGRDVLRLPLRRKVSAGLGYLPQDSTSFADLSARENLLALLELLPLARRERRERLSELLSLVGLGAGAADRPYGRLSGGEQRRLEVAKAFAGRPSVLLLDEPFSGLDPRIVTDLVAIHRRLAGEGVAVLLTDHNVHVTLSFADRAHLLAGGVIVREGPPAEVAASEEARRLYLGEGFVLPS